MLFHIPNLVLALPLTLALWSIAHSIAAAFTITEPGIADGDRNHRFQQALFFAVLAVLGSLIFHAFYTCLT